SLGYTKTPEKESGDFTFRGHALKKAGKNNKIFKEARVEVAYENGILTAKGEAETLLPGVSRGSIEVITGKGESSVKADFDINDSIPGVSGGHLMFQFKKNDKGDWAIEAEANILT